MKKAYERDQYGNIEKTILTAIGEQARTSISEYDILGRFVREERNALGHTIVYDRDDKTGVLIAITDPNNLQTIYTYDGFGRLSTETSPSGVVTKIERKNNREIENEATVGLMIAYVEQVTAGELPSEIRLYDALGRLVRTVSQAFTLDPRVTKWVHLDQKYDNLGRLEKESLPYVRGDQALWRIMTYDAFHRIILVTQPDSNKVKIEFTGRSGGGRFITKYDSKGRRTITELNTRELPTAVVDEQKGRVTYYYDAGDRLEIMRGPTGAITRTKYDIFGQREWVSDPDLGVWSYEYDAFGQLIEQKDAEGQVTTLDFDLLGRVKRKALSDGATLEWEYDGSSKGVGKLQRVRDPGRYEQTVFYDALGRPYRSAVTIGEETFTNTTEWDEYDRPWKKHYPAPAGAAPFVIENVYDTKGFLVRVQSAGGAQLYWQALDIDELGRVVKEDFGNGVETITTYNKKTGDLEGTVARKVGGRTILDLRLKYDAVGSLLSRHEAVNNILEAFTYDSLDRLVTAKRSGQAIKRYDYDAAGRIKKKTGIGDYSYREDATSGPWQPYHAVLETRNGSDIRRYSYDNNGNRKTGNGRTILYTPENLVREVKNDNTHWVQFAYGPSGDRYRQIVRDGQQIYETINVGGFEQEREFNADNPTQPNMTQLRYFLTNGSSVFAIVEKKNDLQNAVASAESSSIGGSTNTWYLHKDQLGSVVRVTNEAGALAVRSWYDPWGQQTEIAVLPAGQKFGAHRGQGFTGHEQLAMVGLIHMNGRIYDFETGMFLSADPVDLVTGYTQSIGRYAYVENNPLKYIDPTGYWKWARSVVGAAVGFVTGGPVGAIAGALIAGNDKSYNFVKNNWREIAVVTVAVGVTVLTGGAGAGLSGAILSGMAAGAAAGGTRAALYGGDIGDILGEAIKGGVIGGISGAAFYGAGDVFSGAEGSLGGPDSFGAIGAHGIVGGGVSELEGGSFWTGFASGAITKASSAYGPQMSGFGSNVVRAAVVGGTVAEISGGKFANGAIMGAYSYALNDALHPSTGSNRVIASEEEYAAYIESIDPPIESSYLLEALFTGGSVVKGIVGVARMGSRGLIAPSQYFRSRTLPQLERDLMRKYGAPRGPARPGAKTWYNPQTGRSYNVHHQRGHQGGKPHVDIRRRGGYSERKYFLRE